MKSRLTIIVSILGLLAASAPAADFGAHVGEYQQDLQAWQVGADAMLPFGVIALAPNIDYSRKSGVGYWFGNGDIALRFPNGSGGAWWVGAGPTYGYVTGYGSGSSGGYKRIAPQQQYNPPGNNPGNPGTPSNPPVSSPIFGGSSGSSSDSAWGWDANAGISFKSGGMRPYVSARYQKIKSFKSASGSVGLRF